MNFEKPEQPESVSEALDSYWQERMSAMKEYLDAELGTLKVKFQADTALHLAAKVEEMRADFEARNKAALERYAADMKKVEEKIKNASGIFAKKIAELEIKAVTNACDAELELNKSALNGFIESIGRL